MYNKNFSLFIVKFTKFSAPLRFNGMMFFNNVLHLVVALDRYCSLKDKTKWGSVSISLMRPCFHAISQSLQKVW